MVSSSNLLKPTFWVLQCGNKMNFIKAELLRKYSNIARLVFYLTRALGVKKLNFSFLPGEVLIEVLPTQLFSCIQFLRGHSYTQLNQLVDIAVVDRRKELALFELHYIFLSTIFNVRWQVVTKVPDGAAVSSVKTLFKGAGWLEREVWDMFGIIFNGNSDLRRLLTDYGYDGHPLRKDYPVVGHTEIFYDDSMKRIIYRSVVLQQEQKSRSRDLVLLA